MDQIVDEPLVEGVYQSLLDFLQISPTRDAKSLPQGRFMKNDTFAVFKVFPEEGGIVWGMVSSNTNGMPSRYVPLRVNNHPKVILLKKFADAGGSNSDLVSAINNLERAVTLQTAALIELARK